MQRNLLQKRKARIIACLFLFAAVLCFAFRIVQMKSENLFLYEVERHKEDYLQIAKYWNKNRNILDEIFYDKEIIYMYEIPELLRKGKKDGADAKYLLSLKNLFWSSDLFGGIQVRGTSGSFITTEFTIRTGMFDSWTVIVGDAERTVDYLKKQDEYFENFLFFESKIIVVDETIVCYHTSDAGPVSAVLDIHCILFEKND